MAACRAAPGERPSGEAIAQPTPGGGAPLLRRADPPGAGGRTLSEASPPAGYSLTRWSRGK